MTPSDALREHGRPLVHRLAAFSDDPSGGNPAGVVVTDAPLDPETMQRVAAEVGYSETAFLVPTAPRAWDVRYFAPTAEVPFCGHATIAAGVLLGRWLADDAGLDDSAGPQRLHLSTPAGLVPVDVDVGTDGTAMATLTSREPVVEPAPAGLVDAALDAFGWSSSLLDGDRKPVVADAGARHLLLTVADPSTLDDDFTYAFDALATSMRQADLTTVAALWPERPQRWHARNAFAVGGVVEDPATGAAAAAVGGWLRASGQVDPPAQVEVLQGRQMGRPSRLLVEIPTAGGIQVSGTAVSIE